MSPAAASTKDCQQFLNQARVPDLPEVYLLGCLERRVTVYSQQVRALNLIYALEQCAGLQAGARIGIVGAGIAGLTAAAAALQRGFAVTLLEEKPSTVLLWRQADCDKRWLHPHVYDWPQQDSLQDDAKLPVMTWTAGTARRVVGLLTEQWQALVKSCQPGRLELNTGVTDVTVINRDGKPQLQWGPGLWRKDCAAVILAVGFGEEQTVAPLKPHSYWADDDLASADTSSSRRCLISGSGDGGLTDVLRASIAGFQHHTFVKELGLDQSTNPATQMLVELVTQIEARVQNCALDPAGEAKAAHLLTDGYLSEEMSQCAAFIDEKLKTRPSGRVVTLNHTGVDVLNRKASALNRLLVSRLIHLGVVTPWRGKLEAGAIQHQPGSHYKVTIDGKSKDFDKVIIRQGVASALEKLNPSWAQKCKATLGPLSILDLTRKQLWPDGWLRGGSGSTPPAAGGGSGGGAGSVLPTAPAATQAAPVTHFVGVPRAAKRDQLVGQQGVVEEIRAKLQSGQRACIGQAVVIPGAGGLGKTQLAVEYVDRYGATYPGGVIWLQADGQLDMQLLVLAQDAGWFSADTDPKLLLDLARQRLRSRPDCLLVFDNLEQLQDIQPYLPPSTASTHILATSRNVQEAFTPIELKLLAPELARKLLIQEAGRSPQGPAEQQAAQNLADRLAGLPLALELAGRRLRHRFRLTFSDYRRLLEEQGLEALPKVLAGPTATQSIDIRAVLQVSEQVLAESPLLRPVLDVLTYSGASAVGRSLLAALLGVSEGALIAPLELGDTLKLLELVPSSRPSELSRPRIHRLVSEARRHYVKATDLNGGPAILCDRLADWFASRRKDFAQLPAFEAELEALRTWQRYATEKKLLQQVRLLWLQAYPHYHHGQYAQATKWLTQALANTTAYPDLPQTQLADLHNDFGSCCLAEGQYDKALTHQREALKIRQHCLNPSHPDVATSMNNIGATYFAQGKFAEALDFQQTALELRKQSLGEAHPDVATSMNHIGGTYLRQGKFAEALDFQQKALELRKRSLGEAHPDVATAMNNIGATYLAQGEYAEALDFQQKALELQKQSLGEAHPAVATSMNNIGGTYLAQGKYAKALDFQQKALELQKQSLGEAHPDVAASMNNIGATYRAQGKYAEALKNQKEALPLFRRSLGEDHPHTGRARVNIGVTYLKLNDAKQGWNELQQGFKILKAGLGVGHPETVGTVKALVAIGGQHGVSLIAQQILSDFLAELPSDHPQRAELEALQVGRPGVALQRPGAAQPAASKSAAGAAKARKKKR